MSAAELRAWHQLAWTLADAARAKTLPAFRRLAQRPARVRNKASDGFDPVTDTDRAAERAMRRALAAQAPAHGIWGEEEGHAAEPTEDYLWVLDPIDGTRSFILGNPLWGTLIACLKRVRGRYQPIVNLVDYPALDERLTAGAQGACWRWQSSGSQSSGSQSSGSQGKSRQRLTTRPCASLAHARIASTSPDMFAAPRLAARWRRITSEAELTRYGGDCYNYGLLAAGLLDAVIERGNATHDTQALLAIVARAGGVITDWQGRSLAGPHATERAEGETLACGDRRLHRQLLARLQN